MNEGFKPTQGVKFGDDIYPLYDLNVLRSALLYTGEIPPEIPAHIAENSARVPDRLKQAEFKKNYPIAIVGYGPTLQEQWPRLKTYQTVVTTSGAYKYLLDRDIVPTHHVEVDYRERKAVHTQEVDPETEFLMCSICHPKTIDNGLRGYSLRLYHIALDGISYPEGELVIPGYWDVGQTAMLVMQTLGYTNQHLFGFDYSFDLNWKDHSGFHNGPPKHYVFAKCGERLYPTSDSLCRGVMTFTQMLKDNPEINIKVFSSGLLGAYLEKHYNGG